MFSFVPCAAGCGHGAITGEYLCARHCVDKQAATDRIISDIRATKSVRDLYATNLSFDTVDFSAHKFYGSNFSCSTLQSCKFSNATMRMMFFEFCEFTGCEFSGCDVQFVSFAGSVISDCIFKEAELMHLNFDGATIRNCEFNDVDLYNSRFNCADIVNTRFLNCNVKKTFFMKAEQENVEFRACNTKDMILEFEL
jgi:uncharacterized protein YjbI with pentapeptide repeats